MRQTQTALARPAGFTLIELILVVALSSMMLAVVAPRLGDFMRQRQLDEGARQLRYVFEHARLLSVAAAAPVSVRVAPDWGTLSLWVAAAAPQAGSSDGFVLAEGGFARHRIPAGLELVSVRRDNVGLTKGEPFELEFEPLLVPHAWELTLAGNQQRCTIRISAGGGDVRVEPL